ncbi:MAG: pseudouridine synthase [Myxococcota bacterium]
MARNSPDGIRLQKRMAQLGIASRRQSEQIIVAGRVAVNGRVVTELGTRVQASDRIAVDGKTIEPLDRALVLLMNKPPGLICTRSEDPDARTIYDLLPDDIPFVSYVGRLDVATEGALILTTDGELARGLTHPDQAVPRVYQVKVRGRVTKHTLQTLCEGVPLDDRPTRPVEAERMSHGERHDRLQLTLFEGRNRHVRRIMEAVGHPVMKLRRLSFGGISVDGLPLGRWRYLEPSEVNLLRAFTRR